MSEATKACSLTETEIKAVIHTHAYCIGNGDEATEHLERMNYLNKRLKTFSEPEEKVTKAEPMPAAPATWGSSA